MMLKILCRQTALGDIRTRQPKSPGVNKTMCGWYRPANTAPTPPVPAHANSCKRGTGQVRCTHCGHTFDPDRGDNIHTKELGH